MTRVAIIGGGLGGLTAGCLLQASGARCTIYEQRPAPGGVATTLLGPQFTVDAGVAWLSGFDGPTPARGLYAQLGLLDRGLLEPEETLVRFVEAATGRRIDVTRDLDRLETDLVALAPDDAPALHAFLEGARAFAQFDAAPLTLGNAPELDGLVNRFAVGWRARPVRRWVASPPWSDTSVDAWSATLRSAFVRDVLRALAGPSAPPWCAMMRLGQHARGGTARVRGGGRALVAALAERFSKLGGALRTDARVARIELEGGRATAVTLAHGEELAADAVVSTADPWQTHGALLGGHDLDEETAVRIADGAIAWPTAFVHLVVEDELPDAPWRAHLLLREPWLVGDHAVRDLPLRYLRAGEGGTPPGHTTIQLAVETTWEWWNDDDEKSQAILDVRRTALVTHCLSHLGALHPGVGRKVRRAEVLTPDVFHAATGAHQGITAAWLVTPDTLRRPLPRRLPGLANVYTAGHWGAVGPCALAAMHAARQAARLLCSDAGLRAESW